MNVAILEIYVGDTDADPVLAYYDLEKARPEFKKYCEDTIELKNGVDDQATFNYGNQCEKDDQAVIFPPCEVHHTIYRFIEG